MPGFAQLLCRWRRVAQRPVTTVPAELDRTDGSRPDAEVLVVRAESAETAQLTLRLHADSDDVSISPLRSPNAPMAQRGSWCRRAGGWRKGR
jgi:hypothetical protein